MSRQHSKPYLITDTASYPLETAEGAFNELWLQTFVFEHSEAVPIAEIEPVFGNPAAPSQRISDDTGRVGSNHGSLTDTASIDLPFDCARIFFSQAMREFNKRVTEEIVAAGNMNQHNPSRMVWLKRCFQALFVDALT
jgi:hypothetical protein